VRKFVNTYDVEAGTDALSTPEALAGWLYDAALTQEAADASANDLRRAVELREALRTAMAANHAGTGMHPEALAVINSAADRARLQLRLTADEGWVASPRAGGVDEALGSVLAIVARAAGDGSWPRLKVCSNDVCRWAFYDHSRARTGKWCSMQICGNRAKQHTWRKRHDR
jgi:predicted RNA-binding Zn ribbon-like protein